MNNKEVYINGKLIDLDEENNPIQIVYSINDLAELKDRQAYSTNTFKAPLTRNNLAICGYPTDVNIVGDTPYRKNAGKVVQGGIEILTNGTALIKRAADSLEIQVLSGLIGFFDMLGDRKISDIDLSDLDHVWNRTTAAASQLNTDGYIYPIINYGGLPADAKEADARQLRPAIFRKTLIERIISEAGYTAEGNYQTYPKYMNSVIPFTLDTFKHGKAYIDILNTYKTSARSTVTQYIDRNILEQTIVLQDDATTDPQNQWDGSTFTAGIAMRVNVSFKYSILQFDDRPGGSTPETYMYIQVNNGAGWFNVAENLTTCTEELENEEFLDQSITAVVDIALGGQIRIRDLQQPATNRMRSEVYAGAQIKIEPVAQDVIYGSEIQMSATLPEVSQKDFFKDFLQNFGLTVIPDNYNKHLKLINMEEVYANKPDAIDITDKLINGTDDVTFTVGDYGINNFGVYKSDDAVPDGLGDGVMVFDNLTLKETVTLFTSIFAASTSSVFGFGIEAANITKIENPAVSTDFKIKTQPRILLNRTINSSQFRIHDGVGTSYVDTISTPLFAGLDYQTLFDENYPEIFRMLRRPYAVTKQALLKETDIAAIDWTVPLYDKRTASYYYCNEIKYIQNDRSTISLILMP